MSKFDDSLYKQLKGDGIPKFQGMSIVRSPDSEDESNYSVRYTKTDGFYTIGNKPQVTNILTIKAPKRLWPRLLWERLKQI